MILSGHGSSAPYIMLIADGGSETDIRTGLALQGDQENKLRRLFLAHRLNYDEAWKTCLIKERINLKDWKQNVSLVNQGYKNVLVQEINDLKPNVIVPLGELSFNFLTGLRGIRKFRGSVLPIRSDFSTTVVFPQKVIPILGPNPYMNNEPSLEFISRLDMGKVARNYLNPDPISEVGLCWIVENNTQLRDFLNRHWEVSKWMYFDYETYANMPTCISICFDDSLESVTVPIIDNSISEDMRVMMLATVAKALASDKPKCNQNIKFDWRKGERWGLKVNNVAGDTMIAASLLYAEFPKNLGFLTSIYTDMPYFKDEGKEFDPASSHRKQLYMYCAKDSLATSQIHQLQLAELEEYGCKAVYDNLITILPIYKSMEERGIRIDDTKRQDLLATYNCLYETYKYKLEKLVGKEVNPLSSVAMQKLVYEELGYAGIRGVKKTQSGGYSADEESLEMLMWRGRSNHRDAGQILRTIIDCRKIHKVIEVLVLPTPPDDRMRCEFNLAGAETGRTTAGESSDYYLRFDKKKVKFKNLGHSFQTFGKHGFTIDGITYGKNLRSIFVPSPGYCFVENDLSQAEARVDAVLAADYEILSVFDGPVGIHKLTGSWVYDCEPSEIKKNTLVINANGVGEDRYHVAKTARHAGERNMREDRLMMMINQPIETCMKILLKFHANQPNIRGIFHKEIAEAIRQNRRLVAPNGRQRLFFGKIDDHAINEGISVLPQAIVTDYMKQSLPATMEATKEYAYPLSEAHDGFLSEVLIGRREEYAQIFKKNIEVPIDFRHCTLSRDFLLTIPCEASVGLNNWQEMEDLKL